MAENSENSTPPAGPQSIADKALENALSGISSYTHGSRSVSRISPDTLLDVDARLRARAARRRGGLFLTLDQSGRGVARGGCSPSPSPSGDYATKEELQAVAGRVAAIEGDYVTREELAGNVVVHVNGAAGNVSIVPGDGVSIETDGQQIKVASPLQVLKRTFSKRGESQPVPGIVAAVYSDTESNKETVNRFDQYFPQSRVEWENWKGNIASVAADGNGLWHFLDAAGSVVAIPEKVAVGVCFFVDGDENVAHFITGIETANNSFSITPSLDAGAAHSVQAIRPALLDSYGLHYGKATGDMSGFSKIETAPRLSASNSISTSDGITVYLSWANNGTWKSVDGGASWAKLDSAPMPGNYSPSISTSDGITVYLSLANNGTWKSVDGGASWAKLDSAPMPGNYSLSISTSDGITVYLSWANNGTWKSVDGGASWAKLDSAPMPGNYSPSISTSDGITVYLTWANNGTWKSVDGGASWAKLDSAPVYSSNPSISAASGNVFLAWGASASNSGVWMSADGGVSWSIISSAPHFSGSVSINSADGIQIFLLWGASGNNNGLWKSSALFGTSANSPFSAIVKATPDNVIILKDFAADKVGGSVVYWSVETDEDEWSIWGAQEYPLAWHIIAKKMGGIWFARTSANGLAATPATSAPEAITIALDAYIKNRIPSAAYSPIYGFSSFKGGIPVRLAATFWPDPATVETDAPGLSGIFVLSSQFSDAMHWSTDDFRIDLSENRSTSSVVWPEDFQTRALIFYRNSNAVANGG